MEYKIISKSSVSILALAGDITRHDKDILTKCHQELSALDAKTIIIVFKHVNVVEPIAFRDLTMIQHEARKKNIDLRVVGLSVPVKNSLSSSGVIRLTEVMNTLDEALTA